MCLVQEQAAELTVNLVLHLLAAERFGETGRAALGDCRDMRVVRLGKDLQTKIMQVLFAVNNIL